MNFDRDTKSFLLSVLNEDMGGGVGSQQDYGLHIKEYDPYDYETDPTTGKVKKTRKKDTQSESDYYKTALQTAMTAAGAPIDLDKQDTTGKPSLELLGGLGVLKRRLGYDTASGGGAEMRGKDITKDALRGLAGGGIAAAALQFMGPLGQRISEKLPYLTAMGVDPFDYATKVMGVDYVSDQLSKLPARQAKQITSGAGHIQL